MTSNSTIVIIGASRGIGKELVLQFAATASNTIYAFSRNLDEMRRNFGHLENVFPFCLDISNSVRNTLENLFESVQNIDILINNSGKLVNKPFLDLTREEIASCYETNIVGVMETVQAALPKMLVKGGHIVNISSIGGFQGSVKFPGLSAYSTSKAALCSFTELFAEEFKDTKVKMNCLCLGAVQTEMLEEAFPGYKAPLSAREMASFIVDFSQTAYRYMNGKILPISLSTP